MAELQRSFFDALLARTPSNAALGFLQAADAQEARRRLEVYRASARGTLVDVLRSTFPIVEALVGERFFSAMALRYARNRPSVTADLHDVGQNLPEFLEQFPPVAELGYLPAVARLEWLIHRAALVRPQAQMRARLHSRYAVHVIRALHLDETLDRSSVALAELERPSTLEVRRDADGLIVVEVVAPGDAGTHDG